MTEAIKDIIIELRAWVAEGRPVDEVVDTFIDLSQADLQQQILDELGDVDLSEPRPDLAKGWTRVRGQLAYNALYAAVMAPESPGARPLWLDADEVSIGK
jgi:hypothetical protein